MTKFYLCLLSVALLATIAVSERVYAITTGNQLAWVDTNNATFAEVVGDITGIKTGHSLRSLDFRPNGGNLVVLSTLANAAAGTSDGQLYNLNLATAALSQIGNGFVFNSSSTDVQIDFNPVVDRIRFITRDGINLRLNPTDNTGGIVGNDTNLLWDAADPNVASGDVEIISFAYTNNTKTAQNTTLYGFEFSTDFLVTIGSLLGNPVSPNAGTTFSVGDSGQSFTTPSGFDISGSNGAAYVSIGSALYSVNLATGAITSVATLPASIIDMSVVAADTVLPAPTPDEPSPSGVYKVGISAALVVSALATLF